MSGMNEIGPVLLDRPACRRRRPARTASPAGAAVSCYLEDADVWIFAREAPAASPSRDGPLAQSIRTTPSMRRHAMDEGASSWITPMSEVPGTRHPPTATAPRERTPRQGATTMTGGSGWNRDDLARITFPTTSPGGSILVRLVVGNAVGAKRLIPRSGPRC